MQSNRGNCFLFRSNQYLVNTWNNRWFVGLQYGCRLHLSSGFTVWCSFPCMQYTCMYTYTHVCYSGRCILELLSFNFPAWCVLIYRGLCIQPDKNHEYDLKWSCNEGLKWRAICLYPKYSVMFVIPIMASLNHVNMQSQGLLSHSQLQSFWDNMICSWEWIILMGVKLYIYMHLEIWNLYHIQHLLFIEYDPHRHWASGLLQTVSGWVFRPPVAGQSLVQVWADRSRGQYWPLVYNGRGWRTTPYSLEYHGLISRLCVDPPSQLPWLERSRPWTWWTTSTGLRGLLKNQYMYDLYIEYSPFLGGNMAMWSESSEVNGAATYNCTEIVFLS